MAEAPERKADLDKDGIILDDVEKAELDKDGISLSSEGETEVSDAQKAAQEPHAAAVSPEKKKDVIDVIKDILVFLNAFISRIPFLSKVPPRILIPGAAALVILIFAGSFALYHALSSKDAGSVRNGQPQENLVEAYDGNMVLDPFMVFTDTPNSRDAGVIIAKVSLQVEPAVLPTIESRLFDIRNIIFKRLASTANVYNPTEIAQMLSRDLAGFPIGQVSFIQYQVK
jgi:flagellar basal body-associated protein FliL